MCAYILARFRALGNSAFYVFCLTRSQISPSLLKHFAFNLLDANFVSSGRSQSLYAASFLYIYKVFLIWEHHTAMLHLIQPIAILEGHSDHLMLKQIVAFFSHLFSVTSFFTSKILLCVYDWGGEGMPCCGGH